MRLSRALCRTKAELLEVLDETELIEQIAYDHIEPLDNPYWRNGLVCEVLSHVFGGKSRKLDIQRWMPGEKRRRMSDAEMLASTRARFQKL